MGRGQEIEVRGQRSEFRIVNFEMFYDLNDLNDFNGFKNSPLTRGYASNIRLAQEFSLTCNNPRLLEQGT